MKLAWKEIIYSKRNYILIELILVMMIFMVIFLSGLANGLARAVSSGIDNADASYYAISDDSEKLINVSNLDQNILDKVKNSTSSKVTTLDIQRMNLNKKGEAKKLDVTYFAINPKEFLNPRVSEGRKLDEGKDNIVLEASFKDYGIKVGDIIVDSTTATEMRVVGFTKDEMYGHSAVGFISTNTYTALRKIINPMYKTKYHTIAIKGSDVSRIKLKGVETINKAQIIDNIPGYKAEQMTIKMILWVLVFVSAAILGVFFYIITLQKHKEFGTMKAIGMRMGEIAGMQLTQVLILGSIGIGLGNLIAFGMASMLPSSMPFYLVVSDAVNISIAFLAITIICSLASIIKIAKVDPVMIIGGN